MPKKAVSKIDASLSEESVSEENDASLSEESVSEIEEYNEEEPKKAKKRVTSEESEEVPKKGGRRKKVTSEESEESEEVEDMEGNSSEEVVKKIRFFKRIDLKTGETSGRYVGVTPKQAASKADTKLRQKFKRDGKPYPDVNYIYIRESTRNSLKKVYAYISEPNRLDKPQKKPIFDKDTKKPVIDPQTGKQKIVIYKYRNILHRAPIPEKLLTMKKKTAKKGKRVVRREEDLEISK